MTQQTPIIHNVNPAGIATCGDNDAMHFGKLLAKLRTDRGLTQDRLASMSGLSTGSIQRGEGSEKCPFRRSNATDLLTALEKIAPLTDNEAENYLQLTGLEALARVGREAIDRMTTERKRIGEEIASHGFAYTTRDEPMVSLAHNWLQEITEAEGVDVGRHVLPVLEGLAKQFGVKLQRSGDLKYWAIHSPERTHPDGMTTRTISPVPAPVHPSTFAKPRAQPKRKSG